MRNAVIMGLVALAGAAGPAAAHSIFPGSQIVQTTGERAFVRFQAANGRKDVSDFTVEVFEEDWTPYRLAVASPARLTVRPMQQDAADESSQQSFSIMVDLGGLPERRLRVCTRSVTPRRPYETAVTRLNSRVCAKVTVRKI